MDEYPTRETLSAMDVQQLEDLLQRESLRSLCNDVDDTNRQLGSLERRVTTLSWLCSITFVLLLVNAVFALSHLTGQ